jgi:hypothetical protein
LTVNLKQLFLTKNACFIAGAKTTPKGIFVHSTGANNPDLKRYVGPDDGLLGVNKYGNHWNVYHPGGKDVGAHVYTDKNGDGTCDVCGGRSVCVHAFIGKLASGGVATYQTLPWDVVGWHSGKGSKGSANNAGYIGFEICEDGLADPAYFALVYQEAAELCAMLCKTYGITPDKPSLICHSEGHALGIASNHGDVMHWFPRHGKSMDTFRAEVKRLMGAAATAPAPQPAAPATDTDTDTEAAIWAHLKSCGMNDCGAAGLMGNLYAESGLRSTNMQNSYEGKLGLTDATYTASVDNGKYTNFVRDGVGYGLAQWTYWSRKENLYQYARLGGQSIGDLQMQLEFLVRELQGYNGLMALLKTAQTVRQASDAVLTQFERPADMGEAVKVKRAAYGQKYFDKYAGQTSTPAPAPALPYTVRVTASSLNIRKGPGTSYATTGKPITDKGVYTITEEADGPGAKKWGKLKSGAGWISLDYCQRR